MEHKIAISRESSNAIKGLLILFIILGHNSILVRHWEGCETLYRLFIYKYLYSFHVYCFFLLPFLYNSKPYQKGNLKKYALKLLYPYLWICILCLIIVFVVAADLNLSILPYAMVIANEALIEESVGFSFPWFLPVMFSLLILKDLYYSCGTKMKISLLSAAVAIWILEMVFGINFSKMQNYVPFALLQALRMLLLGVIIKLILERIDLQKRYTVCLLLALFTVCVASVGLYFNVKLKIIPFACFLFTMPILVFSFLYIIEDGFSILKNRFFVNLGKMSIRYIFTT